MLHWLLLPILAVGLDSFMKTCIRSLPPLVAINVIVHLAAMLRLAEPKTCCQKLYKSVITCYIIQVMCNLYVHVWVSRLCKLVSGNLNRGSHGGYLKIALFFFYRICQHFFSGFHSVTVTSCFFFFLWKATISSKVKSLNLIKFSLKKLYLVFSVNSHLTYEKHCFEVLQVCLLFLLIIRQKLYIF